MFAEQPSVKLCCQLCCGVFKDPVITTCGVSRPASRSPGGGHGPGPLRRARGRAALWPRPKSACCLHSTRSVEDAR